MGFILSIDTAVAEASVCVSIGLDVRGLKTNQHANESAVWLHTAIQQLLCEQGIPLHELVAVAVSAGPGSYTGLRVGMATAKGLCYALRVPLITVNTLHAMAAAATNEPTDLLCPMIDARRLEVFTALYTKTLQEVMPAQALVLDTSSFSAELKENTITFFGNGSEKFQKLLSNPNAIFKFITTNATHVAGLAYPDFVEKKFTDLAYVEPFYGKDFFSPAPRK